MQEPQTENLIRTILKSEITWLIFIIAGIMGFISTVILPLNRQELQLSDIQSSLAEIKTTNGSLSEKLSTVNTRVTVLENDIKRIEK